MEEGKRAPSLDEITKVIMNKEYEHGFAIAKEDILDENNFPVVSSGEKGIITAYLPDMNKFAVDFGKNRWLTFDMTEGEFLNKVETVE
jgi:hypothetical protein